VDEIMKEIWDENWSQSKDIVRVNISRLRHKLNNSNMKNNCIEAVPGEGYVFRIE
jgi:DNA-binding response OmpR family regulator